MRPWIIKAGERSAAHSAYTASRKPFCFLSVMFTAEYLINGLGIEQAAGWNKKRGGSVLLLQCHRRCDTIRMGNT
jgi:hypothetical protein